MAAKDKGPPDEILRLEADDTAQDWADALDACHNAADVTEALSRFHSANWDTYVKWARHHATQLANRVDRHSIDNALSYVTEAAAEAAAQWPQVRGDIRSWPGYVHTRSRSMFRDAMTSPSTTGLTGMSTMLRRRASLARTSETLTSQMGREPTPEEIVETHNAEANRARSDAARQGALATVDDLAWEPPLSTDALVQTPSDPDDDGILGGGSSLLSSYEASNFVADVIKECERRSDVLGMVAHARLGDYGEFSTSIAQLAEDLGITHHVARTSITEVMDVAKAVLYEDLGVTVESAWDGVQDPKAWAAHGFGPHGARRWAKAGFEPLHASRWVVVSLSPSGVAPWIEQGFDARVSKTLADAGMDPAQAREWYDKNRPDGEERAAS